MRHDEHEIDAFTGWLQSALADVGRGLFIGLGFALALAITGVTL